MARALGKALREIGSNVVCIASRNPEHAAAAADFIGGGAAAVCYRDIGSHASHVVIAVSDSAIESVAKELAIGRGGLRVALHTCGSYGPELLESLSAVGVSCGGIHPLQTIQDGEVGTAALRNIGFAVCGVPDALCWAEELVAALGGQALHIQPEGRQLYHAAAVMASNYIAVLVDTAQQLMAKAGIPKEAALRALAPLARTSVENAVTRGPVEALTGPIVRGDAVTVAAHMLALERSADSTAELYRAAGIRALRMARERGLGEQDAMRIDQTLAGRK